MPWTSVGRTTFESQFFVDLFPELPNKETTPYSRTVTTFSGGGISTSIYYHELMMHYTQETKFAYQVPRTWPNQHYPHQLSSPIRPCL